MHRGGWLIGVAGILGVGLFLAVFFLLPAPDQVRPPYFLQVSLPQAPDRLIPLPSPDDHKGATLTFVGDIMLARTVERTIAEKGTSWPFAELGDLFHGSDLVVGNFEGTVRSARNVEVVNQMIFDTTPENVALVADAGFTHLSIANNHADDYGSQVTLDTRAAISENGMTPFGDPYASENFIARENVGGVSLSLIGFHAFGETSLDLLQAIKAEHDQGRFVIVFPHWGTEYAETAPSNETDPAQAFINAGADLIVGAHPHVIQNVEVIGDVPVIYSLGNFLFDQDFSPETRRGMTVQVTITDDTIDLNFTPVSIIDAQTTPMTEDEALAVCNEFSLPDCHLSVVRE